MPKVPSISSRACIDALARLGFSVVRQQGSHISLKNDQGRLVVVPYRKELPKGTLRAILKQAGIPLEDFLEAL